MKKHNFVLIFLLFFFPVLLGYDLTKKGDFKYGQEETIDE